MSDLDKLIEAAGKQQREQTNAARSRERQRDATTARKFPVTGWIAGAVVLVVIFFGIVQAFLPISKDVVRADLKTALDAAQAAVEDYRRVNDELPDRVPVAALANLVQFERRGDGYRLSVSMNGITMTREP